MKAFEITFNQHACRSRRGGTGEHAAGRHRPSAAYTSRLRQPNIWVAVVLIGLLQACVDATNRAPVIFPIDGTVFEAGISSLVQVSVRDADGDPVSVTYRLSPMPQSFSAGGRGRPTIVNVTQGAIFSWTPSVEDVLPNETDVYTLTFTADDGRGGRGVRAIPVSVRAPVQRMAAPIRFLRPNSEGVYVSSDCLEDLEITVEGGLRSGRLRLNVRGADGQQCAGDKTCGPFEMWPEGPGREKTLNWCPGENILKNELHHVLEIKAKEPGSDVAGAIDFFVRFQPNVDEACSGQPPRIQHQPMVELTGPVDYRVEASFDQAFRFRQPPIVAYRFQDAQLAEHTWAAAAFAPQGDGRWFAKIPHRELAEGEEINLQYKLIATADSDPGGAECALTSVSEAYDVIVRPGDGDGRRYSQCEPCRSDAQCEGDQNLCLLIEGRAYCMQACEAGGGCAIGAQCVQIESIDGKVQDQCVPTDLDCGQVCLPDYLEGESGNDIPELAAPVDPGDFDGLTVCAGGRDYYRVAVESGQSLAVQVEHEGERDELSIEVRPPNSGPDNAGGINSVSRVEGMATLPCVRESGQAIVSVWSASGQRNDYTLRVQIGEGQCESSCQPDVFDVSGMPGDLQVALPIELPWRHDELTLCADDVDRYEVSVSEQREITVSFEITDGDAALHTKIFRRENLVKEALGDAARQPLSFIALAGEPYMIELHALNASEWLQYSINIEGYGVSACSLDSDCAAGEQCRDDGRCVRASCETDEGCGPGEVCVLGTRLGLNSTGDERQCVPSCESDDDCVNSDGLSCKAVNDGLRRGCLRSGSEPTGGRCLRHSDCMEGLSCLDTQGGYCARIGCSPACRPGTRCSTWSDRDACMAACDDDGACRAVEGYSCRLVESADTRVCQPDDD